MVPNLDLLNQIDDATVDNSRPARRISYMISPTSTQSPFPSKSNKNPYDKQSSKKIEEKENNMHHY